MPRNHCSLWVVTGHDVVESLKSKQINCFTKQISREYMYLFLQFLLQKKASYV